MIWEILVELHFLATSTLLAEAAEALGIIDQVVLVEMAEAQVLEVFHKVEAELLKDLQAA
jgi:hypothetical protein